MSARLEGARVRGAGVASSHAPAHMPYLSVGLEVTMGRVGMAMFSSRFIPRMLERQAGHMAHVLGLVDARLAGSSDSSALVGAPRLSCLPAVY